MIIRELYKNHQDDIGDYYLLYYYGDTVCDFDFVSRFRYRLQSGDKEGWMVKDHFQIGFTEKISHVFELEEKVLREIFNNSLITRTKADLLITDPLAIRQIPGENRKHFGLQLFPVNKQRQRTG